jgi:iron complex outermembrane recepter protein
MKMKPSVCLPRPRRVVAQVLNEKKNFNGFSAAKAMFVFMMLAPMLASAQKTITGKVFDNTTNKPLPSASITPRGGKPGVLTNDDGMFTITVNEKDQAVIVSHVGYESATVHVAQAGSFLSIGLQPAHNELQGVTIVGSRNLSRSKLQAPVPVDIIPVSAIAREVGQVDLNQLLTYTAPSFQSARQTVSDGTDHIDPAQIRGLGSDQVLVLVNGKRRHQSALVNVNGTVNRGQVSTDFNTIPVSAIERVEILRDGAAAQYGSDAIAGVINIVLKNQVGLRGTVSYGGNITSYDKNYALGKINNKTYDKSNVTDGGVFQAALNYGISLGRKGFMNLSGEYTLRNLSNRTGTYTGPAYPNVNGVNKDDSILAARGLTRDAFDMRIGNSKIASGSFMFNMSYDLGSKWKLNAFGGYSKKNGEAAGIFRYPFAINTAAGTYNQQVLTIYPNGFLPLIQTDIKDYSLSAGINGSLGKWNASLSNTFGLNNYDFDVANSINYTQLAVTNVPQTNFKAGGLRFMQNTVNADVSRKFDVLQGLNMAYGAEYRMEQYSQHAGEEASYKNYNTNSGATAGAQVFAGFVPAYANKHSRNNLSLYADLEQDFTKQLLVQFAVRFENYSDFGSTLNEKLAARYKFGNVLTVRGAISSGFRAPSLQQRFYSKTNTIFVSSGGQLVPTESGTFTNDSKPAEILGIPKLKEETSKNYSLGFTLTPVKNLEISVDGYYVKIKNRIILTNNFNGGNDAALAQLLKDNGATTANFFTNAVDVKAKGLEAVVSYQANLSKADRLKFTLAASFLKNEVVKGADGKPAIKASDVLINSGQMGNYFNREDQSRFEVASPDSKGNLTVNYSHNKFTAMVRLAYFGKVQYIDPSINPDNPALFPVNAFTGQKETLDQMFDPKTVTDVSVSYAFRKEFTLTVGSNNVFDVYQDKHTHSGNVSLGRFIYSRRVEQMGFNGRFVFARVSVSL